MFGSSAGAISADCNFNNNYVNGPKFCAIMILTIVAGQVTRVPAFLEDLFLLKAADGHFVAFNTEPQFLF